MSSLEDEKYVKNDVVHFWKTKEVFGGLSNMSGGYPIKVLGMTIRTSEALYQAMKHTSDPALQSLIISVPSPIVAAREGRKKPRNDWLEINIEVMKWVSRVKLLNNWTKFSELLLATGVLPIVEKSSKDPFWGCLEKEEDGVVYLVGKNVLGKILSELRDEVKNKTFTKETVLKPLSIPDFNIVGLPIGETLARDEEDELFV